MCFSVTYILFRSINILRWPWFSMNIPMLAVTHYRYIWKDASNVLHYTCTCKLYVILEDIYHHKLFGFIYQKNLEYYPSEVQTIWSNYIYIYATDKILSLRIDSNEPWCIRFPAIIAYIQHELKLRWRRKNYFLRQHKKVTLSMHR